MAESAGRRRGRKGVRRRRPLPGRKVAVAVAAAPAQTAGDAAAAGPWEGSAPGGALGRLRARALGADLDAPMGQVAAIVGSTIRASVPGGRIGEICRLHDPQGTGTLTAEIIGLADGMALLSPMGGTRGLSLTTKVLPTAAMRTMPVSDALLGRVVDAAGRPVDGKGRLGPAEERPIHAPAPDALTRGVIAMPLPTGIRAVDGLLTCGEGQRIGIYGEAGGGKSTLMASIVRGSAADVAVIAMIGERGREVREFVEHTLGAEALRRSVVVVATSDRPPGERVAAAYAATTVAEHFRDRGLRVLLLMDSLTRFARAQREVGLAAGEMPTRRGFPISVFTELPGLLERAGPAAKGSITAFYTVLVEGDGTADPIADETRGILDGHMILSAQLAARNHYPAIDVMRSRSRLMTAVADPEHLAAAARCRDLMAAEAEVELLVKVGEYRSGADPLSDEAIAKAPAIRRFLRQGSEERAPLDETLTALKEIAE